LNVAIPAPASPASAQAAYTLQVGAFQDRAKAAALIAELEKRHQDVFIEETSAGKPLYRVRVGRLANIEEVKRLQRLLRSEGFTSFVSALK
jgi:cell division septation protein DedD